VKDYVTACGKKIEDDAVQYLVESSATQLRDLASKLDHLILYCGERDTVGSTDALRVTGVTTEVAPFGLDDAILKGDASRVLEEARGWVEGGVEPLALVGRLRGILQRVWVICGMDERRAQPPEMEAVLGGQKWKLQEFRKCAERIGRQRIEDGLLGILQIEISAKSRPADAVPQIYGWLWALCNPVHSHRAGTSSRSTAYVR
jgi:DNA polymerase III delta subunit